MLILSNKLFVCACRRIPKTAFSSNFAVTFVARYLNTEMLMTAGFGII